MRGASPGRNCWIATFVDLQCHVGAVARCHCWVPLLGGMLGGCHAFWPHCASWPLCALVSKICSSVVVPPHVACKLKVLFRQHLFSSGGSVKWTCDITNKTCSSHVVLHLWKLIAISMQPGKNSTPFSIFLSVSCCHAF